MKTATQTRAAKKIASIATQLAKMVEACGDMRDAADMTEADVFALSETVRHLNRVRFDVARLAAPVEVHDGEHARAMAERHAAMMAG